MLRKITAQLLALHAGGERPHILESVPRNANEVVTDGAVAKAKPNGDKSVTPLPLHCPSDIDTKSVRAHNVSDIQ